MVEEIAAIAIDTAIAAALAVVAIVLDEKPVEPLRVGGGDDLARRLARVAGAGFGQRQWALLLGPSELGAPTKIGAFDESVALDGATYCSTASSCSRGGASARIRGSGRSPGTT